MWAINDGIFPSRCDDLKLFAQIAADGAAVSRDCAVAQTKAVKNAAVSIGHIGIAGFGGFGAAVKAVGVFHDEFAPTHQTKTRTALIAEFGLNLVKVFRQLLIAFEFLAGDVGYHFFAGGLYDKVTAVAVFNAQQLRAHGVKTTRFVPELSRLHHRHSQLNRARAVHLFTNDGFNFADHAQAQRHVVVDASAQALDHPGAHHQLLADDICVGWGFFQSGDQKLRGFHGRGGQ